MTGETRACRACGAVKPIGDFYRAATGKGGRAARCKACENAADVTGTVRRRRMRERNRQAEAPVPFDPAGWRLEAACRDMPPNQFFPHPTDKPGVQAALDVCRGCPVVAACLDFAVGTNQEAGVFGGMSEGERKAERKRRARARRAS